MNVFSFRNIVQEILKAAHKYRDEYSIKGNFDFLVNGTLTKSFNAKIGELEITILNRKVSTISDTPIFVELKRKDKYYVNINGPLLKDEKWNQFARMGYEQGLRTGNLQEIAKYFSTVAILIIFSRYSAGYNENTEGYNKKIQRKIIDIEKSWSSASRNYNRKLMNFLDYIGEHKFRDYRDREIVREGLCQGVAINELPEDKRGEVSSLALILDQWSTQIENYIKAEASGVTSYTIYDYVIILLEFELTKAVSRIVGQYYNPKKVKKLTINPSIEHVYSVILGKEPEKHNNEYTEFYNQLNSNQIKKLAKELKLIKIQEIKLNRLQLLEEITTKILSEEYIIKPFQFIITFNKSKYHEVVNGTKQYALSKGIIK
ncbi:MAG: hypothetical protein ACTSQY_06900 [Candidatus Odinarchaeia archaeon]